MLSVTSGFIKQWGQPNSVVRGKNVVKRQIGCLGTPKLGLKWILESFYFDADR